MRRQQGFTYLGLVILVAIIGLVGAAGLKVGALLQRAAAEEELLEIGAQFSQALKSYADATPNGHPRFPATLNELLRDPRVPGVRRHLRKVFVDPVTGKAEWGLVTMGENAGVLGVYSLSDKAPLKQANFDTRFTNFENKQKISDWKFMLPGQSLMEGGVQQGGVPQNSPQQNGKPPSLFGARPGQAGTPAASVPAGQASAPAPAPAVPQEAPVPPPEMQAPPPEAPAPVEETPAVDEKEEEKGDDGQEDKAPAETGDSAAGAANDTRRGPDGRAR